MSERNKMRQGRGSGKQGQRERGQSLVETAIVFPILLLLLAAVVDFGRAFDAYIVLTNAAREGARWGSVKPSLTADEVKQFVVDDVLGSGTNISQMSGFTTANVDVEGQEDWIFVRVTVWYDFQLWFGQLIGFDEVRLTRIAEMPRWFNR